MKHLLQIKIINPLDESRQPKRRELRYKSYLSQRIPIKFEEGLNILVNGAFMAYSTMLSVP